MRCLRRPNTTRVCHSAGACARASAWSRLGDPRLRAVANRQIRREAPHVRRSWKTRGVGLFGRKNSAAATPSAITRFWDWWASEGRSLDPSQASSATDELNRLVTAIHPNLTWHFGPGAGSQHRLTVSAGGVAEVRPAAERWLRAAPVPDSTWEFRSSQEREPNALTAVLDIAGSKLDLSETAFRIEPDEGALRVHIGLHHPAFPQIPQQAQMQVAYLLLDWLLGEDDVERWVGEVKALTSPPSPSGKPADVVSAVDQFAAARKPDEWTLAQFADREGVPGLAAFQRGLRWIDYPTFDRHQVITTPYPSQENGLPADGATLDGLRELQNELESIVVHRGILVAYESHRGARTYHVYTDGEDQNVDAAIRDWATRRRISVTAEPDPAWFQVRHFTG